MKLATFRHDGRAHLGVVHPDRSRIFHALAASGRDGKPDPAFASMLDLIDSGPAALDRLRALFDRLNGDPAFQLPLADVELMAPVPEPRQMRDCMSFETHIRQAMRGFERITARARGDEAAAQAAQPSAELAPIFRQRPIYYITNRFSVVGHDATVHWPRYSKVMDYELEFGVFIGKTGRNIPLADAGRHIFGYTIYNDFSGRDAQLTDIQGRLGPSKGKSFDEGNSLGPWIVTPDEIPDACGLKASVRINGETVTTSSTANMLFTFEQVIEFVSRDETLHAGEFIGSGTLGNGCGLEIDRYLKSGDTIELEFDKIGVLRNRVVS